MIDFARFNNVKLRAAGLGEVLFDVFESGARLGGAPANFAHHCCQLGLECVVVSAVGRDEFGQRARRELEQAGLKLMLYENGYPTGDVQIKLDDQGVATYDFRKDTAYDHLPFDEDLAAVAAQTNLACYGSLAQRGPDTARSIRRFIESMPADLSVKVFDVNLRQNYYSKEMIEDTLKLSNVFKCNEDELPVLAKLLGMPNEPEAFYRTLSSAFGIDLFIYTLGGEGSAVYLGNEYSRKVSQKVRVVDTVGAGDSFTASLLTGLMVGMPLAEAHERAVAISAYVCTCAGAMPPMPAELTAPFKQKLL